MILEYRSSLLLGVGLMLKVLYQNDRLAHISMLTQTYKLSC